MSVEVVEQPEPLYYFHKGVYSPDPITAASCVSFIYPIFPSIKIKGYIGRALLQVSCVTESVPYRTHPCLLTGEHCADGVYQYEVQCQEEGTIVQFRELVIVSQPQLPPSLSVEQILTKRQEMNIDPFKNGIDHINYVKKYINFNGVRLCFQIFTEDENGLCKVPQEAVVSNVIRNHKEVNIPFSYNILKISQSDCLATGRSKIISIHCEHLKYKSEKEVPSCVQAHFFEFGDDGERTWRTNGITKEFDNNVLKFRPPKYHNVNITEPVRVLLRLSLPNETEYSEATPFYYLPSPADTESTAGPSTAMICE